MMNSYSAKTLDRKLFINFIFLENWYEERLSTPKIPHDLRIVSLLKITLFLEEIKRG